MSIGKNITLKRKNHNWTQKQLAELMNVSDKTISSWENERTYPDISSLIQLSEILNLSLDELIKGDMNMVKSIDENLQEGRKWGRWKWLLIVTSILVSGFILLNIAWLFWVNNRQAKLDNYAWSTEEHPEMFDTHPGLYVKKDDLYVSLLTYQTKHSTPYLHFEDSTREVSVVSEKGLSLWIKGKDNMVFYNGKGSYLELNEDLKPVKGRSKSNNMTKNEQNEFLEKYKNEIMGYYESGLPVFKDLN